VYYKTPSLWTKDLDNRDFKNYTFSKVPYPGSPIRHLQGT
jgi:hypothetical protein